jgi:hypothetical protein
MGLDHYLVGLFAQALPLSSPAIIVAFFFRADRGSAIFFGAVSAMVLPAAAVALGINSRPDVLMAAAIWGALYGWIWSLLKRETPHVETVTASGPKAGGVTPKREGFSMKFWLVGIPLTVLVHFFATITIWLVLEFNGYSSRPALANGIATIADVLFLIFFVRTFMGGAKSDAAVPPSAPTSTPPNAAPKAKPMASQSTPASKTPAQGPLPELNLTSVIDESGSAPAGSHNTLDWLENLTPDQKQSMEEISKQIMFTIQGYLLNERPGALNSDNVCVFELKKSPGIYGIVENTPMLLMLDQSGSTPIASSVYLNTLSSFENAKADPKGHQPIMALSFECALMLLSGRNDVVDQARLKSVIDESGSDPAPKSLNYDQSKWEVVKDHDKRVVAALPKIEALGDEYVELFASKILAVKPNDRDIDAIAKEVEAEFQPKPTISEVEKINAAYLEISEKYEEYGVDIFMGIYEVVGDQIDLEKVLDEIRQVANYEFVYVYKGKKIRHNDTRATVDGKFFPSIDAAMAFIDAGLDQI